MKTLILLLLFTTTASTLCIGQPQNSTKFLELNGGIAFIQDAFVFPGLSLLYGESIRTENDIIIEFEAGLAFPTIATAKLGIGKYTKNTKIIIGIRPYPFNIYLQTNFPGTEKGHWIISFEVNPLSQDSSFSYYSRGTINLGYRWDRTDRNPKIKHK